MDVMAYLLSFPDTVTVNKDVHTFGRILTALMLALMISAGFASLLISPHAAFAAGTTVTYAGDFASVFPNLCQGDLTIACPDGLHLPDNCQHQSGEEKPNYYPHLPKV